MLFLFKNTANLSITTDFYPGLKAGGINSPIDTIHVLKIFPRLLSRGLISILTNVIEPGKNRTYLRDLNWRGEIEISDLFLSADFLVTDFRSNPVERGFQ